MKKLLGISIGFFIFSLCATNEQKQFEYANELYQQLLFSDAFCEYKKISNKGSSIYQNMGQCCFYLKDYPYALAYFGKAGRGVNYFKRKELFALQKQIPDYNMRQSWHKVLYDEVLFSVSSVSLLLLQLLFLVFWFCFCFALLYRSEKYVRYISLFFIAVLMPFLGVKWNSGCVRGIVVHETQLCAGPSDTYQKITKIKPFEGVAIHEITDGWCKIVYAKRNGWVLKKDIKKI